MPVSSLVLTSKDVAAEVDRLAADAGFGYVHVVVADGRIERIDRCVQMKAARRGSERPHSPMLQTGAERG